MTVPYSTKMDPTYENFAAECPRPHCGASNIFNRASDLRTFQPIGLRTVNCQECDRPFNIGNDSVNAAHEMLLSDCFAFIGRKQYMQCVLGVAQAYEVFLSHVLHVQLIYRPFERDASPRSECLNDLKKQLYARVGKLAFDDMRHLVLKLVVDNVEPASLADAKAKIAKLPKKNVPKVERQCVEQVPDERLKVLLLGLLDANPNKLRNRVVHKDAYRPKLDEAKRAHDEAREIIYGLTGRLGLGSFDRAAKNQS
jgi:hypothetical protein